jgi:hypothetical protein
VVATGIFLLAASGVDAGAGSAGKLPPAGIAVLLGLLGLLGLRDKVSFLGARPEIYGTVLIVGLFPVQHWIWPGSSSSSSSGGGQRRPSSTTTSRLSSRR